MIEEITRRLSYIYKDSKNIFRESLIIFIEEIECHLEVYWQREIISLLLNQFPNCQFFISTNSPIILSEINAENIFEFYKEKDFIYINKPSISFGLTVDEILEINMKSTSRSKEIKNRLHEIYILVDEEKYEEALNLCNKLEKEIGNIPALIEIKSQIISLTE